MAMFGAETGCAPSVKRDELLEIWDKAGKCVTAEDLCLCMTDASQGASGAGYKAAIANSRSFK